MEFINYISIFNSFFSESDLNFFREVASSRTKVIVQVINKCISSNDLMNTILFLHKINYIDFQAFEISQIEAILQVILPFLKKFYKNIHFCILAMTLLYKVYNHIPNCQNIFPPYSDLFLEIFLYYKSSPKFLSKDKPRNFLEYIGNYATMTLSDEAYTKMRNEIYEQLIYHYQECNTKNNILIELTAYLPFEYIDNDPELQHAYFNLFLSKRTSVHCTSLIFSKILQNNGTPKIDMKLFIKCFFQKCSVILPYLESKSNPSKGKNDNIDLIMIYLLFNETYLEHLSFTEKCFEIYINQIISLFDGDNSEVGVKLVKRFFRALCFIMCKKEYKDNTREYQKIIYNITNGHVLYQRLWYIIKKFFLNIIELLFYHKIKQANSVLSIIFELLSHSGNISNFDILPWFTILNQICKDNYNEVFYFKKFRTVIPYLLSQVKYNSQYETFIRNNVEQMISYIPKNINELTKQIFKILSIFYINCSEIKNTFNSSYDSLFLFLEEKSIDIIKKTLPLLKKLNNEKSFTVFQIFTFSLTKFASNKTIDNIKKISTEYILKKKDANLPQYGMDLIVNYHEIWDYVFNKMISFDFNRNFEIKSYCLYKDERIKHLSLKRLKHETKQFIFNLKNVFDFDRTQLKLYKDRIYLFIYALVNDYNEKKITFVRHILTFVFSLITINYEDTGITKLFKPKVEYPSKEEVAFVVNLYKDIIIPYENYISINNIDEIDEHIIKIYLLYVSCLPVNNNNLYMIIDDIKTKDKESNELLKLYKELKSLIGNSVSFARCLLPKIKNKYEKMQSMKMLMETFYDEEQSYFYVKHYNQPIKKFLNLIEFIKKYINFYWNKVNYNEIYKYYDYYKICDFYIKTNNKGNIQLESLEKFLSHTFDKDINKETYSIFNELNLSSLDINNTYQEKLKSLLQKVVKELPEKLAIEGNNTINMNKAITIFTNTSLILLSEPNCDVVEIMKLLNNLCLIFLHNNYSHVQRLTMTILNISKDISKLLDINYEDEYKDKNESIEMISKYILVFNQVIMEINNSQCLNKEDICLSFLQGNIKLVAKSYMYINTNSSIKDTMIKTEQFIFNKIFDKQGFNKKQFKFLEIMFFILHEKIKIFKDSINIPFSIVDCSQKKINYKSVKQKTITKLVNSTYTIKNEIKNEAIIYQISYDDIIHLLNLILPTSSNKENDNSRNTVIEKQTKQLLFYCICFGYWKYEGINLNDLIKTQKNNFEIILTPICLYEIKIKGNYTYINSILSDLSIIYLSLHEQNDKEVFYLNIEKLFTSLKSKLKIEQIENLLINQIKCKISLDDNIFLPQMYSFMSLPCDFCHFILKNNLDIKNILETKVLESLKKLFSNTITMKQHFSSHKNILFNFFTFFEYQIPDYFSYDYLYSPKIFELFINIISSCVKVDNIDLFFSNIQFIKCVELLMNDIPSLFKFINQLISILSSDSSNNKYFKSLIHRIPHQKLYFINLEDVIQGINSFPINNELQTTVLLYLIKYFINNNCYQFIKDNKWRDILKIFLMIYPKCKNNKNLLSLFEDVINIFYLGITEYERDILLESFIKDNDNILDDLYINYYMKYNISNEILLSVLLYQINIFKSYIPLNVFEKIKQLCEKSKIPSLIDKINLLIKKENILSLLNNYIII